MDLTKLKKLVDLAIPMIFNENGGSIPLLFDMRFCEQVVKRYSKKNYTRQEMKKRQAPLVYNAHQQRPIIIRVCKLLEEHGATRNQMAEYLDLIISKLCSDETKPFQRNLKSFIQDLAVETTGDPADLNAPEEMDVGLNDLNLDEEDPDAMETNTEEDQGSHANLNVARGNQAQQPQEPVETPSTSNPMGAIPLSGNQEVDAAIRNFADIIQLAPSPAIAPTGASNHLLKFPLFPHQEYALNWMYWKESQTPGGGILGDEFGLGKGIVVMALITKTVLEGSPMFDDSVTNAEFVQELIPSKGTLIVVDMAKLNEWREDLEKYTTNLKWFCHHDRNRKISAQKISAFDIVLTDFPTLQSELGQNRKHSVAGPLLQVKYNRLVVDEAEHLLTFERTIAVHTVQAVHRWLVTGTRDLDLNYLLELDARISPFNSVQEAYLMNLYTLIFWFLKFLRLSPFHHPNHFITYVVGDKTSGLDRLKMIAKLLVLRRLKENIPEPN